MYLKQQQQQQQEQIFSFHNSADMKSKIKVPADSVSHENSTSGP